MGDVGGEEYQHPPLVNENPFAGTFSTVIDFIQKNGWFLLVGVVIVFYLKSKISPTLDKYKQKLADAKDKKYDSETAQSKLEGMEAARRRLQAQLDAQAAEHAEKMKQKEEEKRKQKIEDWDGHLQGKGYRSKYKPKAESEQRTSKPIKKSKPLRDSDYNPLMGSGGSCSWRPGQRRGASGGG